MHRRLDAVMATSSYTAEFGAGVVVNGLDLNPDATKVLVGGRKGNRCVFVFEISFVEVIQDKTYSCNKRLIGSYVVY